MKKELADKMLCPFKVMGENTFCVSNHCMAWINTKEYEIQAFRDSEHNINLSDGNKPKYGKKLSEDETEGYCKRLK